MPSLFALVQKALSARSRTATGAWPAALGSVKECVVAASRSTPPLTTDEALLCLGSIRAVWSPSHAWLFALGFASCLTPDSRRTAAVDSTVLLAAIREIPDVRRRIFVMRKLMERQLAASVECSSSVSRLYDTPASAVPLGALFDMILLPDDSQTATTETNAASSTSSTRHLLDVHLLLDLFRRDWRRMSRERRETTTVERRRLNHPAAPRNFAEQIPFINGFGLRQWSTGSGEAAGGSGGWTAVLERVLRKGALLQDAGDSARAGPPLIDQPSYRMCLPTWCSIAVVLRAAPLAPVHWISEGTGEDSSLPAALAPSSSSSLLSATGTPLLALGISRAALLLLRKAVVTVATAQSHQVATVADLDAEAAVNLAVQVVGYVLGRFLDVRTAALLFNALTLSNDDSDPQGQQQASPATASPAWLFSHHFAEGVVRAMVHGSDGDHRIGGLSGNQPHHVTEARRRLLTAVAQCVVSPSDDAQAADLPTTTTGAAADDDVDYPPPLPSCDVAARAGPGGTAMLRTAWIRLHRHVPPAVWHAATRELFPSNRLTAAVVPVPPPPGGGQEPQGRLPSDPVASFRLRDHVDAQRDEAAIAEYTSALTIGQEAAGHPPWPRYVHPVALSAIAVALSRRADPTKLGPHGQPSWREALDFAGRCPLNASLQHYIVEQAHWSTAMELWSTLFADRKEALALGLLQRLYRANKLADPHVNGLAVWQAVPLEKRTQVHRIGIYIAACASWAAALRAWASMSADVEGTEDRGAGSRYLSLCLERFLRTQGAEPFPWHLALAAFDLVRVGTPASRPSSSLRAGADDRRAAILNLKVAILGHCTTAPAAAAWAAALEVYGSIVVASAGQRSIGRARTLAMCRFFLAARRSNPVRLHWYVSQLCSYAMLTRSATAARSGLQEDMDSHCPGMLVLVLAALVTTPSTLAAAASSLPAEIQLHGPRVDAVCAALLDRRDRARLEHFVAGLLLDVDLFLRQPRVDLVFVAVGLLTFRTWLLPSHPLLASSFSAQHHVADLPASDGGLGSSGVLQRDRRSGGLDSVVSPLDRMVAALAGADPDVDHLLELWNEPLLATCL